MKTALIETAKKFAEIPHADKDAKQLALAWADAVGTDGEKAAAAALLEELKQDVTPIDDLIALLESPKGEKFFGRERAEKMLAAAKVQKSEGARYCGCEACQLGAKFLDAEAVLLA